MCEINPKRKKYLQLEFFTSMDITDSEWDELLYSRLLRLEQEFNEAGSIRVHIHELQQSRAGRVKTKKKQKAARKNGKKGGRPRKNG